MATEATAKETKTKMKEEIGRKGLSVLRVLEKWGLLGLAQLDGLVFHKGMEPAERSGLFFNSKFQDEFRGASYKVMRRLEKAGLVTVHYCANVPRVYTLTADGYRSLKRRDLAKLPDFRACIADSLVQHELLANGIGLVLSEILGLSVSIELERYLLSRGAQSTSWEDIPLPDLWVSDRGQPKAIEVERTQKSAKRYKKLWATYRDDFPPNTVVLYVAAFPNGAKLLLARARKLLADFIYVCSLEEFKASLGRCPFIGYRGGQITLGQGGDRPQGSHPQRVPPASLSARQDVSAGERLAIAPSAPPPQSIRIGELIRPRGRPDQFAAPLAMRPFPRPHPPAPSPTPEGEELLNGGSR